MMRHLAARLVLLIRWDRAALAGLSAAERGRKDRRHGVGYGGQARGRRARLHCGTRRRRSRRAATRRPFSVGGIHLRPAYVFAEKADYRFAKLRTTAGATGVVVRLVHQSEPMLLRPVASEPMPLDRQHELARRMLEKLWAEDLRSKQYDCVATAMGWIDPELVLRWSAELDADRADRVRAAVAERIADEGLDEALSLIGQSGGAGLNALVNLAHRYKVSDPAKAMRCAEELPSGLGWPTNRRERDICRGGRHCDPTGQ